MSALMQDRKCPRCGDVVLSMPCGDGNRLGLCGHVWKDEPAPRSTPEVR